MSSLLEKQDPSIFPNFNLSVALREADIWAKKYPEILEILLMRGVNQEFSLEHKWTIVWKVKEHPYSSVLEFGLNMEKEFKPGFEDIYKEGGFYNWRKEWHIKIINENGNILDKIGSNKHWILYKKMAENTDCTNERKPYLSRIHMNKVRTVAKELWTKHPDMTKAEMIFHDEISLVCEGRVYSESTIGRWIKDLNPNRKPGRRKMKR